MVKPAFSSPVCDDASSLGVLGIVASPTALAGFPQSPASYMEDVKATQNPGKYHVDHLKTEHFDSMLNVRSILVSFDAQDA